MSNQLVKRLAAAFGHPKTEDPAGFLAECARAFKGVPSSVLDVAADIIIKQRRYASWPTIGECLQAIDAAKKQPGKFLEPIEDFDGWWDEHVHRVMSAKTVEEIDRTIDDVRPYAVAKWIMDWRLPWLSEKAEARRAALNLERRFGA